MVTTDGITCGEFDRRFDWTLLASWRRELNPLSPAGVVKLDDRVDGGREVFQGNLARKSEHFPRPPPVKPGNGRCVKAGNVFERLF